MIFDYFDSLKRVFQKFDDILDFFSNIRSIMESTLSQINSFDFVDVIRPYVGTIRYVAGDTVYLTLTRTLQIGLFLILVKTLYELITIIINQFKVQKPLSIIKTFLKI